MAIDRGKQHRIEYTLPRSKYKVRLTIRPAGDIQYSYTSGTYRYESFVKDIKLNLDRETPIISFQNNYTLELVLDSKRLPDELYELFSDPTLSFSENYEAAICQTGYPINMNYIKSNIVFLEMDLNDGNGYVFMYIGYQSQLNAEEYFKNNNDLIITFYPLHKAALETMNTRLMTQLWKMSDSFLDYKSEFGYIDSVYKHPADAVVYATLYMTEYKDSIINQQRLVFVDLASINLFINVMYTRIFEQISRGILIYNPPQIFYPQWIFRQTYDNSGNLGTGLNDTQLYLIYYTQTPNVDSFYGDFDTRFNFSGWESTLNGGLFYETSGKSTYKGGIAGKYENRNLYDFMKDLYTQNFKRIVFDSEGLSEFDLEKVVDSLNVSDELRANSKDYSVNFEEKLSTAACDVVEAIDSDIKTIVTSGQNSLSDNDYTFPAVLHGNPLTEDYEILTNGTDEDYKILDRFLKVDTNYWVTFVKSNYHEFGFYYSHLLSQTGQVDAKMIRVNEYFEYQLRGLKTSSDYISYTPLQDYPVSGVIMTDEEAESYKTGNIAKNKQALNGVCQVGSTVQSEMFGSDKSFTLIVEGLKMPSSDFFNNLLKPNKSFKVNLSQDWNSSKFDVNGDYLYLKSAEISLRYDNERINLELLGVNS